MREFVKHVNDIGSWLVVEKATNEGPEPDGTITDESFDFFVEIGSMVNGKFEADAHHYFLSEQQFKEWIKDLHHTFISE